MIPKPNTLRKRKYRMICFVKIDTKLLTKFTKFNPAMYENDDTP